MKKVIKVTKTDIRLGAQSIMSNGNCIVARAARRAGLKLVSCNYDTLYFGSNRKRAILPLPALQIQSHFMGASVRARLEKEIRAAKPFSFTIYY